MKTIIITVAMVFMACLLTLHTNATFEGWVYLGLFLFIWSLMAIEFVNSLRRKPKPEPDYKQLYFEEHAKALSFAKAIEKTSNDVDDIFESSGKIYEQKKELEADNKVLRNEIKRMDEERTCLLVNIENLETDKEYLKKEVNRLTSKVVELTSEKKDLVDQVNGYRGAFKRHKKGGVK